MGHSIQKLICKILNGKKTQRLDIRIIITTPFILCVVIIKILAKLNIIAGLLSFTHLFNKVDDGSIAGLSVGRDLYLYVCQ